MARMKKGVIVGIHDMGTVWSLDIAKKIVKGKPVGIKNNAIAGDWRPMRDSLDAAFNISSPDFPYISKKKIYENAIGQEIEYTDEGWKPTGRQLMHLTVDEKTGKIKRLKELV